MHLLHSIKKKIIKKIIKNLLHKLKERRLAQNAQAENGAAAREKALSPIDGTVIEMADVPDDIFGQNDIGKGCGIWPASGKLASPIAGTLSTVVVGSHTAIITSDGGMQLLVHVGSSENDTGEKTARILANPDKRIEAGEPLMAFDLKSSAEGEHDQFAIIAVLNSDDYADIELLAHGEIASGQPMLQTVS